MTRRISIFSLAGVLGVSVGAFAQSAPDSEKTGDRNLSRRDVAGARSSLATGSTRTMLRKPVSEVDWDETTLEDVVEWIREQGENRVNVVFRWTALAGEGVDTDSPVTLRLRDTFVGEVLVELMDQLSPAGEVTFHGMDNKLTVSTKADLNRTLHLRVYEVADILFHAPDFGRSAPQVDLQRAARAGGGGGGGGQSIFSGSSSSSDELEEEETEVEERIEALRTLITVSIAPDSWNLEGTGSGQGRISVFDNRYLVVRNTVEVHEELVGYFSLRE